MKVRYVIGLLVIICLTTTTLRADSYWNLSLNLNSEQQGDTLTNQQKRAAARDDLEQDMITGYFIAFVPGFFVHGAGNFYAGNNKRGTALLLTGIAGTLGLVYYGLAGACSENCDGMSNTGKVWVATSLTLFFGSWMWDIFTVGDSIKERHSPEAYFSIGPLPTLYKNHNDPAFGIRLAIRF